MLGHDVVRCFDGLEYKVENTCPSQENKSRITSEPSGEEQPASFYFPGSIEALLSILESVSKVEYKLPLQLYYSIWLPPELC